MSEFSAFAVIQLIALFGIARRYHLRFTVEVAAVLAGSAGGTLVSEWLLAEVAALSLLELLAPKHVAGLRPELPHRLVVPLVGRWSHLRQRLNRLDPTDTGKGATWSFSQSATESL